MADLLWKPPAELTPGTGPVAAPSRLGHFLGLSAAVHLGVAALAPWLAVPAPPRGGEELVRPIDFFPGADGEAGAPAEAGPGRAPGPGRPPPARAVARLVPAPAPAAPSAPVEPPAPVPVPSPDPAESLAPSSTGEVPVGTPKAVPSAENGAIAPPPRPAAIAPPSAVPAAIAAAGPDARLSALVRDLSPGGGDGPRATVTIPRALAGGGVGSGPGAGAGTGVVPGRGAGGIAGTGGSAGGAGAMDAGDPDFTEYFRTIERQVRAVWQFPPQLHGTTQTVKLGFALRLDGTLEEARVLSSTSPALDESAQSAMRRATPFPPLPMKFRALAGQPLVMSFTVTLR
jgi:TonB family protein